MTARKIVIAFDLYGTLLSTESIAHELAKLYGEQQAKTLAALWRQLQLEYTWRINCMGESRQNILCIFTIRKDARNSRDALLLRVDQASTGPSVRSRTVR